MTIGHPGLTAQVYVVCNRPKLVGLLLENEPNAPSPYIHSVISISQELNQLTNPFAPPGCCTVFEITAEQESDADDMRHSWQCMSKLK